jgi:four helix bundle protein
MENASYQAQENRATDPGDAVTRLRPKEGDGTPDESWRRDIQQMMLMVRRLAGFLRSQNLGLLTDQLEQAGYRIVAHHRAADGENHQDDGVRFIQVARSCIQEIEYQLLLAREAGLPGRGSHEPMQNEFHQIRRVLAKCIRRVRNR